MVQSQANTALRFDRRSSLAGLFARAVRNSRPKKRTPAKALNLRASWHDISIDPDHLEAFNVACGIDSPTEVTLLYPMTLAYPLCCTC